jgi:acyl-CoA reductase-like NAD-dependent aldehyde dehydrogenase
MQILSEAHLMTNSRQIIQVAVDAARSAAVQLPFEGRAELLLRIAEGLRDVLNEETTSNGAPGGREWEFEAIAPVIDAAQEYTEAANASKR